MPWMYHIDLKIALLGSAIAGCFPIANPELASTHPFSSRQQPGWWQTVGSTPFKSHNTLDLADFCPNSPTADSTACAQAWLAAAQAQGKHLKATQGIYTLSESLLAFNGMHLRCASPQVIFRKRGDRGSPHFATERYGQPVNPVTNVLIENCGFDMNGDASNFASAINFSQASRVTLRHNRIFDSTEMRADQRDRQRQYVVILSATDILIEDNQLSEGGRIKVGQPGRRLVIRHNRLDFVNDNGITVVGASHSPWPDGTNVSEDILIEGNQIIDPTVTGIFFGADGEPNGMGVSTQRITIINNQVMGAASSCIKGVLPDQAREIWIGHNQCQQETPTFAWSDNIFNSGIRLDRADSVTGAATAITIVGNRLVANQLSTLDLGAIFVGNSMAVCVLDNVVQNSSLAARFSQGPQVYLAENRWGGGRVRGDQAVVSELDDRALCFSPPFLR